MKAIVKVELKFESIDECFLIAENSCSLGRLFDYACALQSYALERMKEAQPKDAPKVEEVKSEE